jgi:alpha-glutamyl/putrescinyl thymine pyrophosphorylase clade 1
MTAAFLADDYYGYARKRQAISIRKAAGEPHPLTDDATLSKYKFTEVFRQNDRTSRHLIAEFYEPHRDAPRAEILLNGATFRCFGTIEFARAIGWQTEFNPAYLKQVASAMGERVWTGAYKISAIGKTGPKLDTVVDVILADLARNAESVVAAAMRYGSLQDASERLMRVTGFADFMAKEVMADAGYTDFWPEGMPVDKDVWTGVGPGSKRGAAFVLGFTDGRSIGREETLSVCRRLYAEREKYWPKDYPPLTLADCQFTLCEYSKYKRTLLGLGKPKALYRPTVEKA